MSRRPAAALTPSGWCLSQSDFLIFRLGLSSCTIHYTPTKWYLITARVRRLHPLFQCSGRADQSWYPGPGLISPRPRSARGTKISFLLSKPIVSSEKELGPPKLGIVKVILDNVYICPGSLSLFELDLLLPEAPQEDTRDTIKMVKVTPPLSKAVGYGVVVGLGFAFA